MKILKNIYGAVARTYDKKIDARGLAVFRIIYFASLFLEVLYVFRFRHLIFDPIPFLKFQEVSVAPVLLFWLIVITFMILGLFTRWTSVINYILTVFIFGSAHDFEYHMYYIYASTNLLVIFLPVSQTFSIDRLFRKLKYSTTRFIYDPPKKVSSLAYLVPVLVCIGFVYCDSILYKLISPYWMHGLGMWLPSSLPMITRTDMTPLLNMEWLMKFAGYLTLIFEATFIFLFFRKRLRMLLFVIGVILHIGILIEYPIPYFATGVLALYVLLLPVKCWNLFDRFKRKKPKLKFFYDGECPLCVRTRIAVSHFDFFRSIEFSSVQSAYPVEPALKDIPMDDVLKDIYCVDANGKTYKGFDTYIRAFSAMVWLAPASWIMRLPGISHIGRMIYRFIALNRATERCTDETCGYTPPAIPSDESRFKILHNYSLRELRITAITVGISLLVFLQISVSLNSSVLKKARHLSFLKGSFVDYGLQDYSQKIKSFSKPLTGITNHPVFMDFHFRNYTHIVGVTFNSGSGSEFLPFISSAGMPGEYLEGPVFVNWTFRVNSADVDTARLSEGLMRYTSFWAVRNHHSLDDLSFGISVKKIDDYKGWEENFLRNQINKPWQDAGTITWKNGVFHSSIADIEKL